MNTKYFKESDIIKIYLQFGIVIFGKIIEIQNKELVIQTQEGNICCINNTDNILACFRLSSKSDDILDNNISNNLDLNSINSNELNLNKEQENPTFDIKVEPNSKLKKFVKNRFKQELNTVKKQLTTPSFGTGINYELPGFVYKK